MGTRKTGPRGELYPTPPAWKALVKKKVEKRGAKAALARAMGVTQSAITQTLYEKSKSSRIAPQISEFLGIEHPSMFGLTEEKLEWLGYYDLLMYEKRLQGVQMIILEILKNQNS